MAIPYLPQIDFILAHAVECDEVVDEICRFAVSLAPEEVSADATHTGYEPMYFGGLYPAVAAFEQGSEEFPKQVEGSPQPGRIDIGLRLYLLSITAENDASPRAGAQREASYLAARWRKNFYNPESENTTMQGRVHEVRINGTES